MPKPLPIEMRERVVEVVENEGLSIAAAAERFRVGTASVKRWLRRARESGSVAPDPMGGLRVVWIGEAEREQLTELVATMSDATLDELAAAYNARHGTSVSRSALLRALQRFDITRKKSRSARPRPRNLESQPHARSSPERSRR